jgi:nitroreductase
MNDRPLSKDVLELLHTRVSSPRLAEPAPEGEVLESILMTAMRAPDHKVLRPARYLLISGERRQALGEVFAEAARINDQEVAEAKLAKCRAMPLRAPLVLVAISKNLEHPKVPVFEQEQSVASGLTHILIALQAHGFGGIWRTGEMAVDAHVKQALGIQARESLVGFLYIGTPVGEAKRIPQLQFSDFFHSW